VEQIDLTAFETNGPTAVLIEELVRTVSDG
jgi:hypothetical protein